MIFYILIFVCSFVLLTWYTKLKVCLGRKLSQFSDISQNSILEKQSFHKIQYENKGLFTKFNSRKNKKVHILTINCKL